MPHNHLHESAPALTDVPSRAIADALPLAVIIPALNASRTLGTTLASVAGQTRLPQAVIVVDDGSADGTANVALAWSTRLPILVIRGDRPRGAAWARNRAISANDLPLLALLDADDIWLPEHLEVMIEGFAQHPGLVTANAHRWVPTLGIDPVTYRHQNPIPPLPRQRVALHEHNFVFVGTLFSRDDYLRAGGFRSVGYEDWDLWIRMSRAGVPIWGTRPPTVLYRVHAGGSFGFRERLARDLETTEFAVREAACAPDRRAAARTRRRLQCELHLLDAVEAAEAGAGRRARGKARRALSLRPHSALRALGMMAAPITMSRLRGRFGPPIDRWIQANQNRSDTAAPTWQPDGRASR
jgi:hypothetical protein